MAEASRRGARPADASAARPPRSRTAFARGFSLVELLVAVTLSILLLLGLSAYFVASSGSFSEADRVSRQIENGQYAMHILSQEIRHAGFYGETASFGAPPTGAPADPCSTTLATLVAMLPVPIQGVDFVPGTSDPSGVLPSCVPDHVSGTDVLVIRRAHTATIPAASAVSGGFYTQTSMCSSDDDAFQLAEGGFTLKQQDCTTPAPLRQFHTAIYFISPCSRGTGTGGACQQSDPAVPTLKRMDLEPSGWTLVPLVEGIENMQLEYGEDTDSTADGSPDSFTARPAATATAWASVMAVRVHLLARSTSTSAGYTDTKTYRLGANADGSANNVTPGGGYKRHAFTGVVRVVNASQRLEPIYGGS